MNRVYHCELIGEQSKPSQRSWTKNFVLARMVYCMYVCLYGCILYTFIKWRVYRRIYGLVLKRKGLCWKFQENLHTLTKYTMDTPDLEMVIIEDKSICRFEDRGKQTGCIRTACVVNSCQG